MFRVTPRLRFIEPQLASPVVQPPEGKHWIHEIKHDGYRSQIVIERGQVRVFSRNGHDWSDRYPGIVRAAASLPCKSAIVDGEAVVQDENGVSNFEALGSAIRRQPHSIILYAFDLLHLDGKDLRQETLSERRAVLKNMIGDDARGRIQFSDEFDGDGAALFKACADRALEGIVSKHALSPYRSGRSKTWLKTKCFTESTFVVIGTDRDRKTGALRALLAHNDGTGLNYAGAAFIALAGEERAQFLGELERLATSWAALKSSRMHDVDRGGGEASGGKQDAPSRYGERIRVMTVYIRPNGDDENDGSENAPVKSPKRAIAIANRNNDQEINLLTTDWARINRELGRAGEDEFPQGGG